MTDPDLENPTPDDFDADDGWNEENGLDVCPVCGCLYTGNGGYTGAVYTSDGRRYDTLLDTDPADRPFFCAECWPELDANQKASENRGLGEFA